MNEVARHDRHRAVPLQAPSIAESSAAAVKSKKAIPPPPAAASPSPQLSLEAATAASVDADALKAEVRRQMEASLGFTGRTASGRSKPAAAEILGPPMEPVGAAPTDMSDWQPDFADAWMDAPAPAPTSASAGELGRVSCPAGSAAQDGYDKMQHALCSSTVCFQTT